MNVEEKRKKKHEKKVERNDHKTLKVFARGEMKKILSVCDSHSKTPRVPVEIFNRIFPSPTSWISRISFQRTVYERWGRDQGWYASCFLFNATWMRIHVGNGFLGWTTCFWNYKCQFFPSLVNSIFFFQIVEWDSNPSISLVNYYSNEFKYIYSSRGQNFYYHLLKFIPLFRYWSRNRLFDL